MLFLDSTLPTPQRNLALDEALLEGCDGGGPEVLRIWRPSQRFVVVGYAQNVEREVNVAACREDGVPILRRVTGGGTVLHDAGSLCYAAILRGSRPEIGNAGCANCWISARLREAVAGALPEAEREGVEVRGDTDLTLGGRKFSGNAQRRKIRGVLFHGTFLLNVDLNAMERYLRLPSRQPEYRSGRRHSDFLTTLPVNEEALVASMREVWGAAQSYERDKLPHGRVEELVRQKYGCEDWNFKL